ncbi:hypothetical protein [Halorussus amylolyticus]|uniref:hypothetical protein n=1 Tax=Halorussus amylolyticus TaxID=1126242 RepID=UPI00105173CD|nr:hypothetical protein [Halorussus amylolyticus]
MSLRSRLGVLQLPVTGVGFLGVAFAASQLSAIPPSPPDSDGFVEGLAVLLFFAVGFVGFVVAALGLAIPPGENVGIRFNRWQRRLFVGAAVAAVASLVVPFVAWPVLASTVFATEFSVLAWLVLSLAAVSALVAGLGWRAAQAVARRVG